VLVKLQFKVLALTKGRLSSEYVMFCC